MKLATWNVNGYRAVCRHGFLEWLREEKPDVVCLQETKADPATLPPDLLSPDGYRSYWHSGTRGGYSGVATCTRLEPGWVMEGIGVPEFDLEGRVLTTEFDRFFLINAYFPNSGSGGERLDYKLWFCETMEVFLASLRRRGKEVVLCGDFNVAHRDVDISNPELHAHHAGFLPEERAWMDRFLASGYVDAFRSVCSEGGHYTWWSYTPGERRKNLGWRIDYFVFNQGLQGFRTCHHRPDVEGSDHCPVVLELESQP